jgi:putative nucleotidyltransferase with HDIG domain
MTARQTATLPGSGAYPARTAGWNLLLVGAHVPWFHQIEQDLLRLHPNWRCHLAENCVIGREALALDSFGAAVLDSRTPGGEQFLRDVEQHFPHVLLFVLCDLRNRSALADWSRPGVNPLAFGADATTLAAALKRGARLQAWMAQPGIQNLLPHLRRLPVMPELHHKLIEELKSPDCCIEVVGQLVAQDPVMTAKFLQVVNSAFFGLPCEITTPGEAVMFLGTERARSLILLADVFSQFDKSRCFAFDPAELWHHSIEVGSFARTIALIETRDGQLAETAFTAGLLHDIGKLFLAGNVPDYYGTLLEQHASGTSSRVEAELEMVGATHAELGACILGTWGFPLALLEAIAWHHAPMLSEDTQFSLVTAVHVANIFSYRARATVGGHAHMASGPIDNRYLSEVGVSGSLDAWAEECQVPLTDG